MRGFPKIRARSAEVLRVDLWGGVGSVRHHPRRLESDCLSVAFITLFSSKARKAIYKKVDIFDKVAANSAVKVMISRLY